MHVFCGKSCPGQTEGFGEKRICTGCFEKQNNLTSAAPAAEIVPQVIPHPINPSVADTSNIASEKTNEFIKDKLPTNFKKRDSKTIHFNTLLLQQIQIDGNFHR